MSFGKPIITWTERIFLSPRLPISERQGKPLTIGELANALPPTRDLETLVYWLAMARQAGIELGQVDEAIDLFSAHDGWTRFFVPAVQIASESVANLDSGSLD
jgi:hypothetical protein